MPLLSNTMKTPTDSMVAYKFKVPDLADHFETFSPEQAHVILEGALNIIFGNPRDPLALPLVDGDEVEPAPTDRDLAVNRETQIVEDVGFALAAMAPVEDDTGLAVLTDEVDQQGYEQIFSAIVEKISADLTADKFNQDIVTLHGEMEFFSRIELYTYHYNTECGLLSVTLAATV